MGGDKVIVDTGPLVGFLDHADQWHDWADARINEMSGPLVTCESVLSEASCLLGDQFDRLLEMVDLGAIEVIPLWPAHGVRIHELMRRYSPRMQLADACIVRLSELNPTARVLTTDGADFRIYRRNRNEAIPLIAP